MQLPRHLEFGTDAPTPTNPAPKERKKKPKKTRENDKTKNGLWYAQDKLRMVFSFA
jgi:hypothetical protein